MPDDAPAAPAMIKALVVRNFLRVTLPEPD
jgi:hypothetical protein